VSQSGLHLRQFVLPILFRLLLRYLLSLLLVVELLLSSLELSHQILLCVLLLCLARAQQLLAALLLVLALLIGGLLALSETLVELVPEIVRVVLLFLQVRLHSVVALLKSCPQLHAPLLLSLLVLKAPLGHPLIRLLVAVRIVLDLGIEHVALHLQALA